MVGVVVNIRNQAGEEARMRQKYHNPQIRTSFSIEEHAVNILTPYAFELLQHEIELSSKYEATKIDNDSYIVRHHTKLDGSMMQCLEVETLKTKDRVVVVIKELKRVIELVKNMYVVPKQSIDLENDVRDDVDDCDVENLITSKTKGRPKGSKPKGELKLQESHVVVTFLIVVE
ncbi:hypothetical protein Lal_00030223 [Lupinus albus]|nr:hypothetical protein Lal_00030223 [Lupinus albus]